MNEEIHSPEWHRIQDRAAEALGAGSLPQPDGVSARPRVALGDLLILRDGFDKLAQNTVAPLGEVRRATMVRSALDELIEHREKEGAHGSDQ